MKETIMAHYKIIDGEQAFATPKEWLPVGAQIGELVNEWSGRDDLVAYVGPGAGGPAPACFIPKTSEVEVNVDVAFGTTVKPKDIHLDTRAGRYEFPRGVGAIMHESFHAKLSQWDIPKVHEDLAADEASALVLLEESRIEAQGLKGMPKALPFLRACAMDIVIGDMEELFENAALGGTATMAQLVGLVYARIDAGVLDFRDVVKVTDLLDEFFGLEKIAALRKIAQEVQEYEKHWDATGMYDSAREWARIVRETSVEKGEPQPGEVEEGEEGEDSGLSEELMDKIREALDDAAAESEITSNDDLADAEQAEAYEEIVEQRGSDAKERGAAEREASKIFSKSTGPGSGDPTGSMLIKNRPPTSEERVAANVVATMLEKAKYHDRDVTEVNSVLPPGRLNARALVQGVAQRERGMLVQAAPWRKKMRKMTDDPSLTVGVICDISGSMGRAMEPMATTAYVLSEAARRVQARAAMVYYGDSVFHTLRPGEHLDTVKVYTAPDGTEKFNSAFKAIDGALNLLHGTGGRLLVIVSDCSYTEMETAKARAWLRRCAEEGVAVVIIPFDSGSTARVVANEYTTVLAGKFQPTVAAQKIGQACADVLTRAGARRG
jgi:hypothetical protein